MTRTSDVENSKNSHNLSHNTVLNLRFPDVQGLTCLLVSTVDVVTIESSCGMELQQRLLSEMSMMKDSVITDDGSSTNITVPIMEDLHLRKFPPLDLAHKHLNFTTCLRNSANLSTQQQVMTAISKCKISTKNICRWHRVSRVQIGGAGNRRNVRPCRMQQRTVQFSDVSWKWWWYKTFSNWRQSSRQLVPSGAYLSGGPFARAPPLWSWKNYEKSKINRKWREHGQFDIVYFK